MKIHIDIEDATASQLDALIKWFNNQGAEDIFIEDCTAFPGDICIHPSDPYKGNPKFITRGGKIETSG